MAWPTSGRSFDNNFSAHEFRHRTNGYEQTGVSPTAGQPAYRGEAAPARCDARTRCRDPWRKSAAKNPSARTAAGLREEVMNPPPLRSLMEELKLTLAA